MILTSKTFRNNDVIAEKYTLYGQNIFPHFEWSNFPKETKSFALICHDGDAPTASGFWHLQVVNIPATVTCLDEGTTIFPGILRNNDTDKASYIGPRPPQGHGMHKYIFTIYALPYEDIVPRINSLGWGDHSISSSRAIVDFVLGASSIDKAQLVMCFEKK